MRITPPVTTATRRVGPCRPRAHPGGLERRRQSDSHNRPELTRMACRVYMVGAGTSLQSFSLAPRAPMSLADTCLPSWNVPALSTGQFS